MEPLAIPLGDVSQEFDISVQNVSDEHQTDYCGNFIYEGAVLKKVLTPEGYLEPTTYYSRPDATKPGVYKTCMTHNFFLRDHLGNTRAQLKQYMNYKDLSGFYIADTKDYYAFGLEHGRPWDQYYGGSTSTNPYLYNGKEMDRMHGLNQLDYGARWYDASLGRWGTNDPLAEKYRRWSTYNYCMNNPVRFIDPDGCAAEDSGVEGLLVWARARAANDEAEERGGEWLNEKSEESGFRPQTRWYVGKGGGGSKKVAPKKEESAIKSVTELLATIKHNFKLMDEGYVIPGFYEDPANEGRMTKQGFVVAGGCIGVMTGVGAMYEMAATGAAWYSYILPTLGVASSFDDITTDNSMRSASQRLIPGWSVQIGKAKSTFNFVSTGMSLNNFYRPSQNLFQTTNAGLGVVSIGLDFFNK
jgi:RHS repeat-associated protein